jgi:hypothetical protein
VGIHDIPWKRARKDLCDPRISFRFQGQKGSGDDELATMNRSEDRTKLLSRQTGMERGKQRMSRENSCTCRSLAVGGAYEIGPCGTKFSANFDLEYLHPRLII